MFLIKFACLLVNMGWSWWQGTFVMPVVLVLWLWGKRGGDHECWEFKLHHVSDVFYLYSFGYEFQLSYSENERVLTKLVRVWTCAIMKRRETWTTTFSQQHANQARSQSHWTHSANILIRLPTETLVRAATFHCFNLSFMISTAHLSIHMGDSSAPLQ